VGYDGNIDKEKVLQSLSWKMLERLFSQGLSLVIQIVLARILLPKDFASLAIMVAITRYATLFVESGLATALVQKEDLEQIDVSTMMVSSLCIALLFYLILFFTAPFIAIYYNSPVLKWALRVLSLTLFFSSINLPYP
jgi:O-antigen/teichoic acid export membrane protein